MAETLVEAWATLKDLYETNNTARILTLQHQLYNLDMNEGDSVHNHLTKVKVVRDRLAAIGHKFDFAQLALMVLHGLPKSYKDFVTTITAGERSKPTIFEELGPLLQEEAYENIYNQSNEKALTMKDKGYPNLFSGLHRKGKPKDSQPKSRDVDKERKKKTKCWYYEKMGHTTKECREKEADLIYNQLDEKALRQGQG